MEDRAAQVRSRSLLNDRVYEDLLARIIGFYFRDYDDRRETFAPTFLLNDILRFWRTLTLNYEHHRLKLGPLLGEELEIKKADSALRNFKLKVSRLSTCFSMVAHLSSAEIPVTPETIGELCHQTPSKRFDAMKGQSAETDDLIHELTNRYAAFLEITQQEAGALRAHFRDESHRKRALEDASAYGDTIYRLLQAITTEERMRFLVI